MGIETQRIDLRCTVSADLEHLAYSTAMHGALELELEHLSALGAREFALRASFLLYREGGARCRCTLWRDGTLRPSDECASMLHLCNGDPFDDRQIATLTAHAAQCQPGCLFHALPLRVDGTPVGLLLAGKDAAEGPWTPHEYALLTSASEMLTLSLTCQIWMDNCAFQNWVFNEIMDTMSACLYVTDVETDHIIFMNRRMKEIFGLEHPEGMICWQLLQKGMTHRCEFCPVPHLLESDEAHPACIWEERNTITGREYENHDTLMHWPDGRIVHVQQSIDVTETKRLFRAATLDELTGLLNRKAGKEAMAHLLNRGRTERRTITACMLDINELKVVNQCHGHRSGDDILVAVSAAMQENATEDDCLFRVGGDEFFLLFYDTTLHGAARRILKIKESLALLPPLPGVADPSTIFSCGLLELPPNHALELADVLSAVDEKMYEQKRFHHIRLAQLRLAQYPDAETIAFDYDQSRLYEALMESTDDYLYVSNTKTGTFRYPRAMVEEFGLPGQVVPNAAAVWGAKVHPDDQAAFLESNQEILDGRIDRHCVEYRAKNRQGEWVWLRCRGHLECDENGEPSLFAGFITNLSKKNRIDPLTGLLNKTECEEVLISLFNRQDRQPISLLIFGVDDLKHINSLYDRNFGDEVIRIASQKMQSMLPPNAYVYRLDGDEFGVVLRDGGQAAARTFYNRVQAAFGNQHTFDGSRFYCTLSCGCATAPEDGESSMALIKYAHFALDHAKQNGKNQICFFTQSLLHHLERKLELTELLRESVEDGFQNFELYYQPIFTDQGQRLSGAEALCRWRCDKYGSISPAEFIPLLEQSGLILPAGRWIFQQALNTCARWQTIRPDFIMSVNLSNLQLEDPTFIEFMEGSVRESHVAPAHLVVELTETYLASDVKNLSDYLERLRNLGVLISMDDFGTGYSALSVLKDYPIDIVKIDRGFVKGIRSNAFDGAFIEFVVELCRRLGIFSCLEGVETHDELAVVNPFSPDFLQGFYFSRPIPAAEFEAKYLMGLEHVCK